MTDFGHKVLLVLIASVGIIATIAVVVSAHTKQTSTQEKYERCMKQNDEILQLIKDGKTNLILVKC